jgi:hypothetical protein
MSFLHISHFIILYHALYHSFVSLRLCGCCDSGQEVEELKEVSTLPILVPELREGTESRKASGKLLILGWVNMETVGVCWVNQLANNIKSRLIKSISNLNHQINLYPSLRLQWDYS